MPTNVIDTGYRPLGNSWQTSGQAINEGLQTVLGYYQEYQKQKRFEQQQAYEHRIKAQEMAERAEQNKMARDLQQRQMDRLDADEWEKNALAMTAEQAAQMPEFSEEQIRQVAKMAGTPAQDAPDEFGGPPLSQIQVGTEEKKVRTPVRVKKFGKSVAVADYGGEAARKAKEAERQADWVTLQDDIQLADGSTYKAGTKVPYQILTAAQKAQQAPPHITNTETGEVFGYNAQTGQFDKVVGNVGKRKPAGSETPGGAYKPVYDKTAKEDVMANDAMIAKEPGRYGPPKKGEAGAGKPVLAGELNTVTEVRSGLKAIQGLRGRISEQDSTGLMSRFAAWVPGVTNLTGWGTDAKARQATIDLVKQIIGKGLEGGVLRKEDEEKYKRILPTMGDRTEVAMAKVDQLERMLLDKEQTTLENLEAAGRDVEALKRLQMKPSTPAASKTDPYGLGL